MRRDLGPISCYSRLERSRLGRPGPAARERIDRRSGWESEVCRDNPGKSARLGRIVPPIVLRLNRNALNPERTKSATRRKFREWTGTECVNPNVA